ncbi:MAG TPA: sensor histidine kinase [Chthoniobacterales bacterium]|nr:sensor histidine kinase [Chthoniobacterales bacterium]
MPAKTVSARRKAGASEESKSGVGSRRRESKLVRRLREKAPESLAILRALSSLISNRTMAASVRLVGNPRIWWKKVSPGVPLDDSFAGFKPLFQRKWMKKVHPEDRARIEGIKPVPVVPEPFEFRFKSVTGAYRTMAVHSTPIFGPAGKLVGILSLYRDTSKERKYEEDAERERVYREQIEVALRQENRRRLGAERVARKQSQALSSSLDLLLKNPEHPQFTRGILRAITRECDSIWATLWSFEDGHSVRRAVYHADLTVEKAVEGFAQKYPTDMERLGQLYREMLEEHRCPLALPNDDPRVPKRIGGFYETIEVRGVMLTPLIKGNILVGGITYLHKQTAHRIDPGKVAFLEAMGKQMMLASSMQSLSETAREAERARENERQALEREGELMRISKLLRLSLSEGADDFQRSDLLLKGVIQNVAELCAAETVSLWRWNDDLEYYVPSWEWKGSRAAAFPIEAGEMLGQLAAASHAGLINAWAKAGDGRIDRISIPRVRKFLDEVCPRGTKLQSSHILGVPLVFNEEVRGFILVSTSADRPSDPQRLALRALALQATLILRLHELASAQRSAALVGERSRIARDMHDLLAQSFSGITLQVEAMKAECPMMPMPIRARLDKIRVQADRSVEEVRRSIQMLRPSLLGDHTLADALVSLGRETESIHEIAVKVAVKGELPEFDPRTKTHLFSVAFEAVQNAIQHAAAKTISISLKRISQRIRLEIEDDGGGFDLDQCDEAGSPRAHYGLLHMKERAREIGGLFNLTSAKGAGTRVEISVRDPS